MLLLKGEGRLDELAPLFAEAGLGAVRWASLPGKAMSNRNDPYNFQIAYCDIAEFTPEDFDAALSLDPVAC